MGQIPPEKRGKEPTDKKEKTVVPLGSHIIKLREARGLYEEDIAKRLDMTEDEVMDIEANRPTLASRLSKLATFFGVDLAEIRMGGRKLSVKVFGDKIRFYREQRGLTQKQLAQKAECGCRTLWNIEHNEPTSPDTLSSIATQLGVPYAELVISVPDPSQELLHDFVFDAKVKIGGRRETANGVRYDIFKVQSLADTNRSYRAKRYDLSILPTDDEASIAAILARHPKICYRLRDCPQVATNITTLQHGRYCWVIDDWYAGPTLDEAMLDQRIQSTIPNIMREIALGLQAIHEQQVVWRELSPEAVIIRQPQQAAVLTDFELAKILTGATTVSPNKWKSGNPYRAPEVETARGDLSPSADLYSWAVIMAHALSRSKKCPASVADVLTDADLPPRLKKLAVKCLGPADERPSLKKIIPALKMWKLNNDV